MELDTKSISILNKPRKTVTSPRLLTINHERQKPLFCPKTLARQALEPQVFRPESLPITIILELQRRLVQLINQAGATELSVFEIFGETEATASVLEQLTNIRERATSSYSRLSNLLLRISEFQPIAPAATIELLTQTIEQAEATAEAPEATVREAKSDWNLL